MDASPQKILAKVHCSQAIAKHFLGKFIQFFNHVFETKYDGSAYFEAIHDGFIVVVDDEKNFQKLFRPPPAAALLEIQENPIENNVFLEEITEDMIPTNGFFFDFEFIYENVESLGKIMEKWIKAINPTNGIEKPGNHVKIIFPNWMNFKQYVDLLYLNIGEI